jgi:tRNA-splicing ligase RtcB
MLPPITILGEHDAQTVRQLETCVALGAARGVLCADGHLGYAQPVGGVCAYRDAVSISGVGFDIGCGNLALRLDARWADLARDARRLAEEILGRVSFGVGRKNPEPVDHELFDDPAWKIPAVAELKKLAREQLGTVGSGNHYVDVFEDERDGAAWVGVHFGSRGLGHRLATHFLRAAGGRDGMMVPPTVVKLDTDLGSDYLAAMRLAGRYAHAGREHVARLVARDILRARAPEEVHNHHNFAWRETHGGEKLWVVRKGATPAFPGQRGFVGGSMGDLSVILRGVDSARSRECLYSTVHGAGRVMSRTAAAGRKKFVRGRAVHLGGGAVDEKAMRREIAAKGILLLGAGADEAPQVYRPLERVLAFHAGTIEVEARLRPKIVVMAGGDEFDPYKD